MNQLAVKEVNFNGDTLYSINNGVKEWSFLKIKDTLYLDSQEIIDEFNLDLLNKNKEIPIFNKNKVDYLDIIESANLISMLEPLKVQRNLNLLELAEIIVNKFNKKNTKFMFFGLRNFIMDTCFKSMPNEKTIHIWFKENYRDLLGNDYEIVNHNNNPKHIPDFWLQYQEEMISVEIKYKEFNNKALEQLNRYINFYKCKKGIAIGKRLTCKLPNNIEFFMYDESAI